APHREARPAADGARPGAVPARHARQRSRAAPLRKHGLSSPSGGGATRRRARTLKEPRMNRLAAAAFALGFALPASAATPPTQPKQPRDTKMSNVYTLAHAGAILEVCREIADLSGRLAELVRTIGQYYKDGEVPSVYEATKAHLASDTKLKFHVKNN